MHTHLHALNTHAVRVGEVRGVEPQPRAAVAADTSAGDDGTSEVVATDRERRAAGVKREAGKRRAVQALVPICVGRSVGRRGGRTTSHVNQR